MRTHIYKPKVNLAEWRLRVDGLVERELALAMAEIEKLPRVEQVAVLECAGNGRSFYEPGVAGMQWRYGAVGNARWTGVRLADVLHRAGVKSGAAQVLFNGADVPMGTVPDSFSGPPHTVRYARLPAVELSGRRSSGPVRVAAAIMVMCASEFSCRCCKERRMQTSDSKTCDHSWARSDSPSASEATITSSPSRAWQRS